MNLLLKIAAAILVVAGVVLLVLTRSGAIPAVRYVPLLVLGAGIVCFRVAMRLR
ncbi:MAG: hypothetical protein JO247_09585 [Chloroflexi bacterium]|nr:hypothetical protein [Chloroflexota bacterium]